MNCEITPTNFIPCPGLKLAIHSNTWNSHKNGIYVCELTNIRTLTSRVAGVVYRFKQGKKGSIFLSYCPFCGTKINEQQNNG